MDHSRQEVVDLVKSWDGKKESNGSHKEIIDIYNTLPAAQLPRKTKMLYTWAWCACTWSALAVKLGYTAIMPIEISCAYLIKAAKSMGVWVEDDSYIPKPGDAILYDWQDNGVGDNTGAPDHVRKIDSFIISRRLADAGFRVYLLFFKPVDICSIGVGRRLRVLYFGSQLQEPERR